MLTQIIKTHTSSNTKDEPQKECTHLSKTGDYCIKCGAVCYNKVKKNIYN